MIIIILKIKLFKTFFEFIRHPIAFEKFGISSEVKCTSLSNQCQHLLRFFFFFAIGWKWKKKGS